MLSTREQTRAFIHQLGTSAWTLSAIAFAFESGLVTHLREPRTREDLRARVAHVPHERLDRCLDVLASAGAVVDDGERVHLAEGVLPFVEGVAREALEGEMRSALMQACAFVDSARQPPPDAGWRHVDETLLRAQGASSGVFAPMFKAQIVPQMGDLEARLAKPGARFLDVGVGVASLATSMCRVWPELHVVGVDPFEAPLSIARREVERAGLAARIELRCQGAEDLRDEAAFDLAWCPACFVPAPLLGRVLERIRASLRPGGWIVLPILGASGDEQQRAVWMLVNALWGGPTLSTEEGVCALAAAGFEPTQTIAGPPWAPTLLVARR